MPWPRIAKISAALGFVRCFGDSKPQRLGGETREMTVLFPPDDASRVGVHEQLVHLLKVYTGTPVAADVGG